VSLTTIGFAFFQATCPATANVDKFIYYDP
jgi:hypothetical protein